MKRISEANLKNMRITKGELSECYNIGTYDTALPQPWVDTCMLHGFDPRGVVVWAYPLSMPYPLTEEAADQIKAIFEWDIVEAELNYDSPHLKELMGMGRSEDHA